MVESLFTWRSEVRMADLGRDGHLLPHRLLEQIQEAAAFASTQAGYSPARYVEMGASWFIKEIRLAIDDVAGYGEAIEIDTWISWIRRFRSHRDYVVRAGGRVIARGQAEWLFLESSGGAVRPRMPDEQMQAAFPRRDEVAIEAAELLELVDAPPAIEPHRASRVVQPSEIDGNGHVNHVRYLAWLDDHGSLVHPDRRIRAARLAYVADARPGDRVDLALHETDDADLQFITRDDQPVMRATVRRTPRR